ncbi:MAG: lytic transglycosylase domain-containing protein [Bdellovibrionales bacterium]|nr:lytic transglycosylase domain-containing protein [Bdellovibrionales bacterium]
MHRAGAIFWIVLFAFKAQAQEPIRLNTVVEKGLTGLVLDEKSHGRFKELRKSAQEFVDFRAGKMDPARKVRWIEKCSTPADRSVFCEFLVEPKAMATIVEDHRPRDPWDLLESSETGSKSGAVDPIPEITRKLNSADFNGLKNVPEARILKALKTFREWKDLEEISSKVLDSSRCPSTGVLTGLGLKAEEFFPDPKYRSLARAFYSRASECDSEEEAANKARYRLALLMIWDSQCENALPILTSLSQRPSQDQYTRIQYWRAFCAINTSKMDLAQSIRDQMVREQPLSFHSILLSENRKLRGTQLLDKPEPEILFRSREKTELNPYVQAIEVLLEIADEPKNSSSARKAKTYSKAHRTKVEDLVQELANALSEKSVAAERGFRLYVAHLMSRSKDPIAVFRLLSQIFKEDPAAIARSSLKLFYPIRYGDTLKAQRDRVDFFLLASLIRQESGFSPAAQSPVGALGLMQLMPTTARLYERVSKRELLDGKTNIRLGAKYLRDLLAKYKGDSELALAAYNAGPEKVEDWVRRYPTPNRLLFFDLIPFRETRDYVTLIARNYYWYLHLYGDIPDTLLAEGSLNDPKLKALHWVKPKTRHSLLFTFFAPDAQPSPRAALIPKEQKK